MDNNLCIEKFDEIDGKVDFLIELCQTLQSENLELTVRIKELESELGKKDRIEDHHQEQQAAIQSKIDGLLLKLKQFSQSSILDESISNN